MSLICFYEFRLSKPARILLKPLTRPKFKPNYSTYNNGVNYAY